MAWLIIGLWLLGCPREATPPLVSKGARAQGGVSLGLFASEPDYNYEKLLNEIVMHHAQRVQLVVPFYLDNVTSHDMQLLAGHSPSQKNIERTLQQAQGLGLEIQILPILRLKNRSANQWRGVLSPAEGSERFFDAYERVLTPLAKLAGQYNVKSFVVGSELLSLEHERALWARLIAGVRTVYSGQLLYAANWDQIRGPDFWDLLDGVGVSAYFEFELPQNGPRIPSIKKQWGVVVQELHRIKAMTGKPVVLTEVGYPSQVSAAEMPWNETAHNDIDLKLQADLYAGFCLAMQASPEVIQEFFFWNWFGWGGPEDDSYTPRHKPAARIMSDCLKVFPPHGAQISARNRPQDTLSPPETSTSRALGR